MICVKQVIFSDTARRGRGLEYSPIRNITEVFDFDGNLIADTDVMGDITPETILDFLKWHYKDIPESEHRDKIHKFFIEQD